MTGLLAELGMKIADRWLTALLLPGLLFAAVALGAHLLGWAHAVDPTYLSAALSSTGKSVSGQAGRIVVAVVVAGLLSTGAGLAAHSLGGLFHRACLVRSPRWWVLRRRRRARAAVAGRHPRPPLRYLPRCATPIGDRFRLIGERIDAQYGLDTTLAWPRLWLLLTDGNRVIVQSAYDQYRAAATLAGWGVLYLALGVLWPPALVVGLATVFTGYGRAGAAAAVLADLIEATIDSQQAALAALAGVTLVHGRITPAEGARINDVFNKRA